MSTFNIVPASLATSDLFQAGAVELSDDQLADIDGGDGTANASTSSSICLSAFGHDLICFRSSSTSSASSSGTGSASTDGNTSSK
jgi:anthranilate phosphoribosyltransferase